MTAPGQIFETDYAIIDGRVYRVWKHLWPSIREFWRACVTDNPAVLEKEYLVFENERITYRQADEMIQKLASILRDVRDEQNHTPPSVLIVLLNLLGIRGAKR